MQEEKKKYKPGFWCSFFWVVTWLGMLTGIVVLFFTVNNVRLSFISGFRICTPIFLHSFIYCGTFSKLPIKLFNIAAINSAG